MERAAVTELKLASVRQGSSSVLSVRAKLPSSPASRAMAAGGGQPAAEAPAGQTEPCEEERAKAQAKPLSPLLRELGAYVVRALLCLAPVYLAGYLGLSTSWVLIGLLLWMWWRRNRRDKRSRLLAAFGLVEDEKEAIARGIALQQLPAWVSGGGAWLDCALCNFWLALSLA